MNEVQAVKNPETIKLISQLLEKHHGQQLSDIWNLGLNVALRISDLLSIRFEDIQNDRLTLTESKTGKVANIKLNSNALAVIDRIKKSHPYHVFLFQSHQSNRTKNKPPRALGRQRVAVAFKDVGEIVGIQLGTHSMRKTRGFHMYKRSGELAPVMAMLRHSSPGVTLRYIGIEQADIDRDFTQLNL